MPRISRQSLGEGAARLPTSDTGNQLHTVTLHSTAAYADLCTAASEASALHHQRLSEAGARSTLRRHLGLQPEPRPLTQAEMEAKRLQAAQAEAAKRKWRNIQRKHDAYKALQEATYARSTKEAEIAQLRVKVNKILVSVLLMLTSGLPDAPLHLSLKQAQTPLKKRVGEVIGAFDLVQRQRAVQRYVDWQDNYYTPVLEGMRRKIDSKVSRSHASLAMACIHYRGAHWVARLAVCQAAQPRVAEGARSVPGRHLPGARRILAGSRGR